MKFKGQVKIPELDSPGVPAVIVIEDPQAELFVEGESLGRWSLVDVRAERLIASAFSLNLDGDELTFIADDPIDFAYGGVDQMANVWARYKTMTLPRRMVATTRSRKGTKPSRISDLRVAIEQTMSAPPQTSTLPGLEPRRAAYPTKFDDVEPETAPISPPEVVAEQIPAEVETDITPLDAKPRPIRQMAPEPEPVPDLTEEEPPAAASESVISEEVFAEPPAPRQPPKVISMGPTVKESIFKDVVPWAKKKTDQPDDDVEETPGQEEARPVPEPPPPVVEPVVAQSEPVSEPQPEPAPETERESAPAGSDDVEPEPEPEVERTAPSSPVEEPETDESVPWLDPTVQPEPSTARHLEPAAMAERPTEPGDTQPRYVVDLGAFEEHADASNGRPKKGRSSEPESERVLEPAMATSERGGLMGAVRSAFVRNRESHDHEYVTAPGGMGIVRNICAQCGHISIGVSE